MQANVLTISQLIKGGNQPEFKTYAVAVMKHDGNTEYYSMQGIMTKKSALLHCIEYVVGRAVKLNDCAIIHTTNEAIVRWGNGDWKAPEYAEAFQDSIREINMTSGCNIAFTTEDAEWQESKEQLSELSGISYDDYHPEEERIMQRLKDESKPASVIGKEIIKSLQEQQRLFFKGREKYHVLILTYEAGRENLFIGVFKNTQQLYEYFGRNKERYPIIAETSAYSDPLFAVPTFTVWKMKHGDAFGETLFMPQMRSLRRDVCFPSHEDKSEDETDDGSKAEKGSSGDAAPKVQQAETTPATEPAETAPAPELSEKKKNKYQWKPRSKDDKK